MIRAGGRPTPRLAFVFAIVLLPFRPVGCPRQLASRPASWLNASSTKKQQDEDELELRRHIFNSTCFVPNFVSQICGFLASDRSNDRQDPLLLFWLLWPRIGRGKVSRPKGRRALLNRFRWHHYVGYNNNAADQMLLSLLLFQRLHEMAMKLSRVCLYYTSTGARET